MNLKHLDAERQCFGCTKHELRESIERSATFQCVGYEAVAMSMMSDAQECIELNTRDSREWARQLLNRAKWVLSTYRSVK